jgi:hypothetical protein
MIATSVDARTPGPSDSGEGRRLEPDSAVFELGSMRATEGRPCPDAPLYRTPARRLTPRQAPGRETRKARAYTSEILRLRELGYTFEAIRGALADVGVKVSISTVRRECMHPIKASAAASAVGAPRDQAKTQCFVSCSQTTANHP